MSVFVFMWVCECLEFVQFTAYIQCCCCCCLILLISKIKPRLRSFFVKYIIHLYFLAWFVGFGWCSRFASAHSSFSINISCAFFFYSRCCFHNAFLSSFKHTQTQKHRAFIIFFETIIETNKIVLHNI